MDPLYQAIMLNNEGAQLLKSRNISGALHAFTNALVSIKSAATCRSEETSWSVLQNDPDDILLSVLGERADSLSNLQNEHCYIYNRPFSIPTDLEIFDLFVCTVIPFVIFNFALASQHLGKITGHAAPMRRAVKLYSLALKIFAGVSRTESSEDKSNALLQCLVLNNIAQLLHDQCDYLNSKNCLERMRNLIVTTACLQDYLNKREADEIMLNLECLRSPTAAHAA